MAFMPEVLKSALYIAKLCLKPAFDAVTAYSAGCEPVGFSCCCESAMMRCARLYSALGVQVKEQVPASKQPDNWFVYLIQCRDGSLYTGISTDVGRRFAEHVRGGPRAARYLRGKGPLVLVYHAAVGTHSQAAILEGAIKRLPRTEKRRLIAGEMDIASLGVDRDCLKTSEA
jgi:putative endonuclease